MTTILRLDASARKSRSLTRTLSTSFIDQWREADPTARIIERDVGTNPPSLITEDWIATVFADPEELSPEQQALVAQSDALIAELQGADVVALGLPLYWLSTRLRHRR